MMRASEGADLEGDGCLEREGKGCPGSVFEGKLKVKRGSYDPSLLLTPSYSTKVHAILD